MLATNLNYANETFELKSVKGLKSTSRVEEMLSMGASVKDGVISFGSVGSAAFVLG